MGSPPKMGELEQAQRSARAMRRLRTATDLLKPLFNERMDKFQVMHRGRQVTNAIEMVRSVMADQPDMVAIVVMMAIEVAAIEEGVSLNVEVVRSSELEGPNHG